MDGNPNTLTASPLPPPLPPKAKILACPTCGNSLTVRGMEQTESIVCDSCGSVIDITDENLKIISTFQSKIKYQPLIPLGTRGKIRGELFEVIGYLRRKIDVEGVEYEWSEYLLFNPYKGFRWLAEYNGHWNYIKTTTNFPKLLPAEETHRVSYLGQDFLHFQTAFAQVSYVIGEFYWKVSVGETCQVIDYVSPPLVLSKESTDQEVTWSIGEYIEPETLWNSFQLKTPVPLRIGVAPNQPSPFHEQFSRIWRLWLIFFLSALFIQILILLLSNNKLVYQNEFAFHRADQEKSRVTEVFEIPGRPSNVVIQSKATVNNSWIYLNMALINEETGQAYDFGREISYYYGRDGGESYSEGSNSDEAILPAIPAGRYYLRIEPDAETRDMNYSIRVYRDVPRWSYFFIAIGALVVFPIFHWWRSRSYEVQRWAESDHPKVSTSDSDEE